MCTCHFKKCKKKHTNYLELTNRFKNQNEEVDIVNELNTQIVVFEQRWSGYIFDNIKELTVKMFRYKHIRASSYCKLPKPFCNSKSILNLQNTFENCFLRSISVQKYKVNNQRERDSNHTKFFHEHNQGDIHFPMKI